MTDFKILRTVVQTAMNWLTCQPSVSQAEDLQKISSDPRRKPQHVQKNFYGNKDSKTVGKSLNLA
ncbi:MAG: hypothetical protein DDG60_01700 [Anaerolineae bacterium]|nr:MAG: hypothetical protein DDG60_01700 [Anaerolineae bacterium]